MSIERDFDSFIALTNGHDIDDYRGVLNRLKEHVYLYPDENISKYINNWILYNIQDEFLKPSLKEAFNMSDDLKYTKIATIYNNLPCLTEKSEYQDYFYHLLTNPSEYYGSYKNFINGCKYFFDQMNNNMVSNELFSQIRRFIADNQVVFSSGWKSYGTYEEEANNLKMICSNVEPEEFTKLKYYYETRLRFEQEYYTYDDIVNRYKNEKIGKLGEIYSYEELKKLNPKTMFIARDCGDGFGYDILFPTESVEYLIEVKSSLTTSKDSFVLSPNENNTLLDTLNRDRSFYIIDRVYIDPINHIINRIPLEYNKETDTFYNYTNPNNIVEFTRNQFNPLMFNRKENVLTLK